jgi:hypothetical protein
LVRTVLHRETNDTAIRIARRALLRNGGPARPEELLDVHGRAVAPVTVRRACAASAGRQVAVLT